MRTNNPARRPTRARCPHLLVVSVVGFGLLYLGAALVLGATPGPNDSGAAVVAWFHHHAGSVRMWLWLLTLSMPLLGVFGALVRAELPQPHGDVFFAGVIAFVVETSTQGWLWAGLAWHTNQLQPATARSFLDVASFWGPVLTSSTVLTLVPVTLVALRGNGGLPRWLAYAAGAATVEQLVETITIFGNHGFAAPGGPMNTLLGAGLVAAAWLGLGLSLARQDTDHHQHQLTPLTCTPHRA
jgi:hypothetical protein